MNGNRLLIIAAAAAAASLSPPAAEAEAAAQPAIYAARGLASAYHSVKADCAAIDHRFGRNAAWGHWRIPLAAARPDAPLADENGAHVRFQCRDQARCIAAEEPSDKAGYIAEHTIPFASLADARGFVRDLKRHHAACRRAAQEKAR